MQKRKEAGGEWEKQRDLGLLGRSQGKEAVLSGEDREKALKGTAKEKWLFYVLK